MSVTPSDWLRVSDLRWLPEVNVEAAGGLLEDSQFLDVGKRRGVAGGQVEQTWEGHSSKAGPLAVPWG